MRRPLALVSLAVALGLVSLWLALRSEARRAALDAAVVAKELDARAELEPTPATSESARVASSDEAFPTEGRVLAADPADLATLELRVVATPGGEAVARARVLVAFLRPSDPSPGDPSAPPEPARDELRATTDWRGRAEIELPSGVASTVRVDGPTQAVWDPEQAFGSAESELGALARGERREVVLSIPHGFDQVFWLRVVDETSAPIAGARIGLPGRREAALSGGGGLARLELGSWEHPRIEVEHEGFAPVATLPEAGHASSSEAFEVVLKRSASLEARLRVPAGFAAPGAELRLQLSTMRLASYGSRIGFGTGRRLPGISVSSVRTQFPSAVLDAGGHARIADLQPGPTYFAALLRDGELAWRSPESLVFEPGERRQVDWCVFEGSRVSGQLIGEGAALGTVLLLHGSSEPSGSNGPVYVEGTPGSPDFARSDAEGRFVFERVQPGRWIVISTSGISAFEIDGGVRLRIDDGVRRDAASRIGVAFEVGEEGAPVELELPLFRAPSIRGRVVDANGSPVSEVEVVARSTALRGELTTRSDRMGNFELGPLHPSPHELWARTELGISHGVEGPHANANPGDSIELVIEE